MGLQESTDTKELHVNLYVCTATYSAHKILKISFPTKKLGCPALRMSFEWADGFLYALGLFLMFCVYCIFHTIFDFSISVIQWNKDACLLLTTY